MKDLTKEIRGVVKKYYPFMDSFGVTRYKAEQVIRGLGVVTTEDRKLRMRIIGEALAQYNQMKDSKDVLTFEYLNSGESNA